MLFFENEQETLKLYVLGEIVTIRQQYGEWLEIDLNSGWLGKWEGKMANRNLVKTPPTAQIIN